MRLSIVHEETQHAGPVFDLVMSPEEWKDVHGLAQFARAGIAYDCDAPYVVQVFTYMFSQPEDIQSNERTRAAFSSVDRMAEQTSRDGQIPGDVELALPKEEMRQLLIVLNLAADSEKQADLLYNAARETFPYPFPDIEVASHHYAQAFDDLLTALHHDRSLTINLTAASAAPKLDRQNLPPEVRPYLQDRMRELIAQNPEIYAADKREIETQTDELIEKINSRSSMRHRDEMAPTEFVDRSDLKESVEKKGGFISAPLSADELQSRLSADQWSKMTKIDPEVIKAEERAQREAFTPSLRRYNLESRLAETLLGDERIRVHLRR